MTYFAISVLTATILFPAGHCLRGILMLGGSCSDNQLYKPSPFGPDINQTVPVNVTIPHFSASVMFAGNLIIFGGSEKSNGQGVLGTVTIYNPLTQSVTKGANMFFPRAAHTAQVYGKHVFVCGGIDAAIRVLGNCEMYDPYDDKWSMVSSPMVTPVHSHGSATLTDETTGPGTPMMYIFGGVNATGYPTDAVYSYFYSDFFDYWVTLQPMNRPRAAFGYIEQYNHVLLCGGWTNYTYNMSADDIQIVNTCDYYDPVGDIWAEYPSMVEPRQYPVMVRYKVDDQDQFDQTYIMGGYSSFMSNETSSVETYVKSNPRIDGQMMYPCAGFISIRVGDAPPCESKQKR